MRAVSVTLLLLVASCCVWRRTLGHTINNPDDLIAAQNDNADSNEIHHCEDYRQSDGSDVKSSENQKREKTYYVHNFSRMNWFKASEYCRYQGMQLASITSEKENDKLAKSIMNIIDSDHKEWFWTSGSDLGEQGRFVWMSTGRPFNFTNWMEGEPNNINREGEIEHCLMVELDNNELVWNDGACSRYCYFVCEA